MNSNWTQIVVGVLVLAASSACAPVDDSVGTHTARARLEIPPAGECDVVTGNVRLANQFALDAFASRQCVSINGSLLVESAQSLAGLATLEIVTGDLIVRGVAAPTLGGLENLRSVGGRLVIEDTATLTDATLPALTSVDGLVVSNNALLLTVAAGALTAAPTQVNLRRNPRLQSLDLAALPATGRLSIVTSSLASLDGLGSLGVVATLELSNNPLLTDLTALSGLTNIAGHLVVRQHPQLATLDGLDNVVSVQGRVALSRNDNLSDVSLSAMVTSNEFLFYRNSATSLAGINAAYQAAFVEVADNMALTDLTNIPIGPASTVSIGLNPSLASLSGLGATAVTGLDVWANSGLRATSVPITGAAFVDFAGNGSTSLTFPAFAGDLTISVYNNSSLASFSAPVATYGDIDIDNNASLTSVSFPAMSSLQDLDIFFSPVSSIDVPLLTEVDDDLRLVETEVTSMAAFAGLLFVDDELVIEDNDDLEDVTGLESLTEVSYLIIDDNDAMTSLAQMSSLAIVNEDLTITDNPALPDSCANNLVAGLTVLGGVTTIMNNGGAGQCN